MAVHTQTPSNVGASGSGAASGTADSGNPVKVAGRYNVTKPTATDGQRLDLQMDSRGGIYVAIKSENSTGTAAVTASADGRTASNGVVALAQNDVYNGATWDRQRGNVTGTIVIPPRGWMYAAASGGIDNSSTAVTLVAAGAAGIRNYLHSLQIDHDLLGAATEIAVRDGAAGTVLWRGKLQTAAVEGHKIVFNPPLFSTAATLLEFLTISAVTGDVMVNAQGYTAP